MKSNSPRLVDLVRKPYSKPVLHLYGDVAALTRSNAGGGTDDGMGGTAMQKTLP